MALYDPVTSAETIQGAVDLESASRNLGNSVEQARNLLALARGLYALPEDYSSFDMRVFFSVGLFMPLPEEEIDPHACGAVACAVGHGPSILGVRRFPGEEWVNYAFRVLGVSGENNLDAWHYLFESHWASYDDTPRGAALRILRVLRRGVPDSRDSGRWHDYLDESPVFEEAG